MKGIVNPLTLTVAIWVQRQSVRMSKITNQLWHRMLYSCTHMASAGVKGLIKLAVNNMKIVNRQCLLGEHDTI